MTEQAVSAKQSGFIFTAEGLLEQAKNLFASEDFISGVKILRSSFSEDITNDQILAYLKAETGLKVDDNGNIEFSEGYICEDYKADIEYILSHYELIFDNKGKYIVPSDVHRVSANEYSPSLAIFKQLSKHSGKFHESKISVSNDTALCEYIKHLGLTEGFHIYKVSESEFFIVEFSSNSKPFYEGISKVSSDTKDIVERYLSLNDWI